MKKFALIVAGGSGNRMKNPVPKQFLKLNGKPVLMWTFEAFLKFDPEIDIILVLDGSQVNNWKQLCKKHRFNFEHKIVAGGENRFLSVRNGLDQIDTKGIVFIHDGVRPVVAQQTIDNCYQTTLSKGNALPVIAPSESVRYADDKSNSPVDRSKYFLVQTPQTFHTDQIKQAYLEASHTNYTDDASVLESSGASINLVEGNRENIKITWPQDLIMAEAFLTPQ